MARDTVLLALIDRWVTKIVDAPCPPWMQETKETDTTVRQDNVKVIEHLKRVYGVETLTQDEDKIAAVGGALEALSVMAKASLRMRPEDKPGPEFVRLILTFFIFVLLNDDKNKAQKELDTIDAWLKKVEPIGEA